MPRVSTAIRMFILRIDTPSLSMQAQLRGEINGTMRGGGLSERLHHPRHGWMGAVLHLKPVLRPATAIRPVTALADKPLQPQTTCSLEEIRPDLAALEGVDEDALRPARQQALQVGLAHRQRQLAKIIATFDQDVEGA